MAETLKARGNFSSPVATNAREVVGDGDNEATPTASDFPTGGAEIAADVREVDGRDGGAGRRDASHAGTTDAGDGNGEGGNDGVYGTIYISEDLMEPRLTVLFNARLIKRQRKIQKCWSTDGRINMIKIMDNTGKICTVQSIDEINALIA